MWRSVVGRLSGCYGSSRSCTFDRLGCDCVGLITLNIPTRHCRPSGRSLKQPSYIPFITKHIPGRSGGQTWVERGTNDDAYSGACCVTCWCWGCNSTVYRNLWFRSIECLRSFASSFSWKFQGRWWQSAALYVSCVGLHRTIASGQESPCIGGCHSCATKFPVRMTLPLPSKHGIGSRKPNCVALPAHGPPILVSLCLCLLQGKWPECMADRPGWPAEKAEDQGALVQGCLRNGPQWLRVPSHGLQPTRGVPREAVRDLSLAPSSGPRWRVIFRLHNDISAAVSTTQTIKPDLALYLDE